MLLAIEFDNLHQILRSLYTDMMPLCGNMAGVAKGIAGLGALFYVAAKVWQSLASAEPIDVYPLFPAAYLHLLSVLSCPAFLFPDFPCLLYLNFILNVLVVFLILPVWESRIQENCLCGFQQDNMNFVRKGKLIILT